ncbi:hypothetical protein T12_1808 [Trichinella patagoniensis]|uniref:Secreted protein n=1 Tax=Trichinella patagoniensis TaxID=990121 RepID=A0A0V0ZZV9_9BILA|nr:hypothetical protein T12_1808 [Trichinella patagoniensis]
MLLHCYYLWTILLLLLCERCWASRCYPTTTIGCGEQTKKRAFIFICQSLDRNDTRAAATRRLLFCSVVVNVCTDRKVFHSACTLASFASYFFSCRFGCR